ncbi:hypothetical protein HMPREF0662_00153, partial [Prevotella nigrescens F0103]
MKENKLESVVLRSSRTSGQKGNGAAYRTDRTRQEAFRFSAKKKIPCLFGTAGSNVF